jgi:hypothetical protein
MPPKISSIGHLLSSLALSSAGSLIALSPGAIAMQPIPASPVSTPSPRSTPSPAAITESFLINITYTGGSDRRANGQPPEFIIRKDGTYFYRFLNKETPRRRLTSRDLKRLTQRLDSTNFSQIKSQPFKGTCPIVYDGNELIYKFKTKSGALEELASCKVVIPGNSLLFQQVNRLSQAAMADWK